MTAATTHAPVLVSEPSHWLRDRAGAQLRRLRALGMDPHAEEGPVIIAPLAGTLPAPGARADRTCDRCGLYCPPGVMFWPLAHRPTHRVMLVGGLCGEHARAEGVGA